MKRSGRVLAAGAVTDDFESQIDGVEIGALVRVETRPVSIPLDVLDPAAGEAAAVIVPVGAGIVTRHSVRAGDARRETGVHQQIERGVHGRERHPGSAAARGAVDRLRRRVIEASGEGGVHHAALLRRPRPAAPERRLEVLDAGRPDGSGAGIRFAGAGNGHDAAQSSPRRGPRQYCFLLSMQLLYFV